MRRKTPKGFPSRRLERLYQSWLEWIGTLYGPTRMVQSLDGRSCIGVDDTNRAGICFAVSTMTLERKGKITDAQGSFWCDWGETRRIFAHYHRLRARFAADSCPTHERARHLQPGTWTKLSSHDWRRPPDLDDVPLFIASLIACWDQMVAKPVGRYPGKYPTGLAAFQDSPVPKFVRVEGLPESLGKRLRKHLVRRFDQS